MSVKMIVDRFAETVAGRPRTALAALLVIVLGLGAGSALLTEQAKVPGLDGRKMSKSYGNHVWIFEEGKALKKAIGGILTDSRGPEEPKDPKELLLFDFLRLFVPADEVAQWEERVRRGGPDAPGYGHLKARIVEGIDACFGPARARRKELLADRGELERILTKGAEKARTRARAVRDRALAACGLRAPGGHGA